MGTLSKSGATAPAASSGADIDDWRPEDEKFWESTGKRIAYRNLWISVPALLCGFAVWGMWGIITVQMLNLGFPFTQAELFTLMMPHMPQTAKPQSSAGTEIQRLR